MGEDLGGESDGDPFGTLGKEKRELDRQGDGFLVPAVVRGRPLRGLGIEKDFQRKRSEPGLDVPGRGGVVPGKDVPPVPLGVDEQVFLPDLHHGVANGGIPVGVVLHGVADDVGHLVVPAVLLLPHGVQDTALDWLEAVLHMRDGTLQDHIGRILQEPIPVHPADVHGVVV